MEGVARWFAASTARRSCVREPGSSTLLTHFRARADAMLALRTYLCPVIAFPPRSGLTNLVATATKTPFEDPWRAPPRRR